ncbi:MAG TPA: sulfurtransferase TusA family protein [Marmoricola sp.]|nr:sulfurtransferase TusA family protein [Marmoricola sp.]
MIDLPDHDLLLDCRGMICPRPIIELGRHIDDVAPGQVIAVLADDPAAAVDVPAWCRMRAHEYVGVGVDEGTPAYFVRRAGAESGERFTT